MTAKTTQYPSTAASRTRARTKAKRGSSLRQTWGPWIAIAAVAILGVAIWKTGSTPAGGAVAQARSAPAFSLPATDGSTVSLADSKGQNVLIYFSEGVGCDACFYQMTSLEKDASVLKDAGITKVIPIVVNPMNDVQQTVQQFDLKTPWLVDGDKSVSSAYNVIGTGMHADLPGHSFVLIDASGQIKWQMAYPSMFASAQQLVKDMGNAI
jgi:peroxiredoxin